MSDTITDADAWLEVRVGESCTVLGMLEHVGFGNPGHLVITFADWSQLVVDCARPRDVAPIPLTVQVYVRAERTEDGLRATSIRTQGGVPIPLVDAQQDTTVPDDAAELRADAHAQLERYREGHPDTLAAWRAKQ